MRVMPDGLRSAPTSAGVAADERFMQSIDRNARHETREEEPGDANPDRKCARERLPRHDIAITDCEAGDEGEIDGVADRPALDKANQHGSAASGLTRSSTTATA